MKSLSVQIAIVPDRTRVVSEIWFGDDQVAEVSNDAGGVLMIEIFRSPTDKGWVFDLDDLQKILANAKEQLARL